MRARFILSQIAAGLRANLAMAISVVLVTFVSLTFVGAGILLQMQIGKLKDDWYDKVEISVFMCPSDSLQASCAGGEATQAQLDEVQEILECGAERTFVENAHQETKEEASENLQEQFADEDWAQAITDEQMQYSFRVKHVTPEENEVNVDELTGRAGVQEVLDRR